MPKLELNQTGRRQTPLLTAEGKHSTAALSRYSVLPDEKEKKMEKQATRPKKTKQTKLST